MLSADRTSSVNVFSQELFWDVETCRRLCEIARISNVEEAGVYRDGKLQVDPGFRKTRRILLDRALLDEIGTSFLSAKPRIEEFFQLSLKTLQGIQLLQYRPGDYFHTHADEWEPHSDSSRKVSIVLFLNSGFEGGDLVLYPNADECRAGNGIHIVPKDGLFIAFSSYTFHEVQEVLTGERFSLVSWFY
jgi:predicted 2-oxoglutarate/Fe(II)-dependent dioxygenase YbiX